MLLYYIQTNAVCVILFIIMFLDMKRKETTKDQRLFFLFIIDAIIFCIADCLNYSLMGRMDGYIKPTLYVVDTFYFGSSAIAAYYWFLFILEKIGVRYGKKHYVRHLLSIPIIAFLIFFATILFLFT